MHPCSTLSDCCQLATTLNAEVQKIAKKAKIGGFSPPEGDRINRSRRNLARKRRPWSAIAHQIWPSSVKGGRYRSPQKCQNLPKIVVFGHRKLTQRTHTDEIWRVSVDLGSVPTHQIWPSSLKGGRYRSAQKCQNLPKIVVFGHRELTQ